MDKDDLIEDAELSVLPSGEQNANKIEKTKKKRDRQKKRRKWKPYHTMSWREKKKADKTETKRANRVREEMFAKGQAIAPYNTTQFLMEDHNQEEPNYFEEEEDVLNDSLEVDQRNEGYMEKQFIEAYENVHIESLNEWSKSDLVQEYLKLEDKVEELEKQFRQAKENDKNYVTESDAHTECSEQNDDAYKQKVTVFIDEIEKLRSENDRLRTENEELSVAISDKGTSSE